MRPWRRGTSSLEFSSSMSKQGSNRRFKFELRTCFSLSGGGFDLAMHPTMQHRLGALGRANSHPGRYPLDGHREQCPPGGHPGLSRRSPSGDGSSRRNPSRAGSSRSSYRLVPPKLERRRKPRRRRMVDGARILHSHRARQGAQGARPAGNANHHRNQPQRWRSANLRFFPPFPQAIPVRMQNRATRISNNLVVKQCVLSPSLFY